MNYENLDLMFLTVLAFSGLSLFAIFFGISPSMGK